MLSSLLPLLRSPRRHLVSGAAIVLALLIVVASGPLADAGVGGRDSWTSDSTAILGPGVSFTAEHGAGPVSAMTVEVEAGAPVRFLPVVSGDRVDGGRETVSSMCHRADALACVNANFPVCPSCGDPFGGVVKDGVLVRSPDPVQDQVSMIDGRFTSVPFEWRAGLQALIPNGPAVHVDGVNSRMIDNGIVLFSPEFGAHTSAPPGAYELVIRAPESLRTGSDVRQQAVMLYVHKDGAAPIPGDGYVLSALGSGADELWAFVERYDKTPIELFSSTPDGLSQSISGHPVLIRDGARVNLDPGDPKVVNRHPRTLMGWNDQGKVWLVVVDGRQGHSRGMDLAEASEHLLALGATEGVNLDGGGSSTMVTSCGDGHWCARNRPSDGQERRVWVALAVIGPSPAMAAASAPPPTAPPTTVPPTTLPVTTTVPVTQPVAAAEAATSAPAAVVAAAEPVPEVDSSAAERVVVALPNRSEPQPASLDRVEIASGFVEFPSAPPPSQTLPPLAVALAAVAVAVESAALRRLVAIGAVPGWVVAGATRGLTSARAGLPSMRGTAGASYRWARDLRRIRRGGGGA